MKMQQNGTVWTDTAGQPIQAHGGQIIVADGYYYSKSIALFKYLLEHPQLLDRPANEEVEF